MTPEQVRETLLEGKFDFLQVGGNVTDVFRRMVEVMLESANKGRDEQEQILSTLLASERNRTFSMGNGIGIPHLMFDNMCVTGWFVSNTSATFSDGAAIRLVFCALADTDRLAPIMAKACDIITRKDLAGLIAKGETGSTLLGNVYKGIHEAPGQRHYLPPLAGEAISTEVMLFNRRGLHARASARLVQLAGRFKSVVRVGFREDEVSATSIMSVMMLSAPPGSRLRLRAMGPDAAEAIEAITNLIALGFNEID